MPTSWGVHIWEVPTSWGVQIWEVHYILGGSNLGGALHLGGFKSGRFQCPPARVAHDGFEVQKCREDLVRTGNTTCRVTSRADMCKNLDELCII